MRERILLQAGGGGGGLVEKKQSRGRGASGGGEVNEFLWKRGAVLKRTKKEKK